MYPYPRARCFFYAIHKITQIVPPKITLPYCSEIEPLLILRGFLIHTKMKMLGLEEGTDLIDVILAHLVIYRRRKHTRIILQPNVVRCGKFQRYLSLFVPHFSSLYGFNALIMQVHPVRIDAFPACLHHTHQTIRANIVNTILGETFKIFF